MATNNTVLFNAFIQIKDNVLAKHKHRVFENDNARKPYSSTTIATDCSENFEFAHLPHVSQYWPIDSSC